jgi:two-component system OmpR family response regulator
MESGPRSRTDEGAAADRAGAATAAGAGARARVLVADDEAHIRDVVQYALEREGYAVSTVPDGESALRALEAGAFDVLVLDVMMPGADGLEVCRRVRATTRTPVVFVSARGDEVDRVVGLELGGDDYLVKPFSPRELVARVRAVLRRAMRGPGTSAPTPGGPAPMTPANAREPRPGARGEQGTGATTKVLRHGRVRIDVERYEVHCGEAPVALTRTEFGVLVALLERPGVVLSRTQLMQRAYPYDNLVTERTIDTHVKRIRQKFRAHGEDPVATVHGVGYKAG